MPYYDNNIYTILTSKLGYGTYIPALLLKKRLEADGKKCDLLIVENYYDESKLRTFNATRDAFYLNPRLAIVASNMRQTDKDLFLISDVKKLFANWAKEERRIFICFSGFWADIVKKYNAVNSIRLFCVIMDAMPSANWHIILTANIKKEVLSFFDFDNSAITHTLNIDYANMIEFKKREKQIVVHGGGWGIFNYGHIEGPGLNYKKIILVRSLPEKPEPSVEYLENIQPASYVNDFPKFRNLLNDRAILEQEKSYHDSLDIVGSSKAIVSKPGGMTLLDSLITSTPIVFLPGIGKYEEANRKLWISKGLGIDFEDWKKMEYSEQPLELMNENLIRIKKDKMDLFDHLLQQLDNS